MSDPIPGKPSDQSTHVIVESPNADIVRGVVFGLTGLTLLALMPTAVSDPAVVLPGTDGLLLRPDFYPLILSGLLALSGVALTISGIRGRSQARAAGGPLHSQGQSERLPNRLTSLWCAEKWQAAFVGSALAYGLAIPILGFPLSTALFTFIWARQLGGRWFKAILASILTPAGFVVLFRIALSVPLPLLPVWLG